MSSRDEVYTGRLISGPTAEEWVPIPGFDGYEVSNLGNVRSLRKGTPRHMTPFMWPPKDGESFFVQMVRNGTNYRRAVAPLVLEAFKEAAGVRIHWNHLDGDPANCRADNLVWASAAAENPVRRQEEVLHGADHPAFDTEDLLDSIPDEGEPPLDIEIPEVGEPDVLA